MSSQESIAAQFWLWPDPVMKRDSQGRLLFINAAFLQLYGGTVEAWTGNVLQGWPAPQPIAPGAYPTPYRFETRMPAQDSGQTEQVYDWIEQTSSDGSAFALARNVSPFVTVQTPPLQTGSVDPAQNPQQDTAQTPSYSEPTGQNEAPQALQADAPSYENPPVSQTEDPSYQTPPHQNAEHVASSIESEANPITETQSPLGAEPRPSTQISQPEDYATQPPQSLQSDVTQAESGRQEPAQSEPVHSEDPSSEPSAPEIPRAERDFERRALPLDSDSTVLGNNWRDAVIAKALGVEEAPAASPTTAATEDATPANSDATDGSKQRILLAEDNAINALLTRTLLEAEGHIVETVEDGVLAVEAMKVNNYDLIFMDMRMPNMDGLEATRKIRALPNVPKSLPIIALTANAFDDDRNACFDSGMNDFMTKPVSAEELTQMVKTWTGKEAEKTAA